MFHTTEIPVQREFLILIKRRPETYCRDFGIELEFLQGKEYEILRSCKIRSPE
jgi:hypothetical protein